ncbi:hypothetical protein BC938DRAFT_471825 [Jimgerdemannia flammicorona]|uniref:Dihydrolipoamide acetyltransferase component of pyruvate dehydrogenase complex n=1 Tax=Jimgerdemannia flammicorona TaxID=994334 RepID=A0A433Q7B0_9FUNG|nr:hypothetical protein BC938DRAFT_471825 [Jimgerdemannia flammicorona]
MSPKATTSSAGIWKGFYNPAAITPTRFRWAIKGFDPISPLGSHPKPVTDCHKLTEQFRVAETSFSTMYRSVPLLNRLLARSVATRHVAEFHTSQNRQAIARFNMPAMSPTMTEGTITRWKKKEGDVIVTGDVLVEVETDKAQIDVEANEDGILAKILVDEGKKVPVNSLIALLAEEGDDLSNIEIPADTSASATATEEPAESKPAAPAPAPPRSPSSSHASSHAVPTQGLAKPLSPAVLSLLSRHHISDPSKIPASGPGGRILKGDLLAFLGQIQPKPMPPPTRSAAPAQIMLATPPKAASDTDNAKTTTKSKSKAPPSYVQKDIVVDELVKLRRVLNEQYDAHFSLNDFFVRAASLALRDVPAADVRYSADADFAEIIGDTSVSIASATPTGLITPIVRQSTSEAIKELSARAKKGKVLPEEYQGGLFSISNQPQAATLAIGAARKVTHTPGAVDVTSSTGIDPISLLSGSSSPNKKSGTTQSPADDLDFLSYLAGEPAKPVPLVRAAAEVERKLQGAFDISQVVSVKLSVDERVVDAAVAGRFLDRVNYYVANPENLLL